MSYFLYVHVPRMGCVTMRALCLVMLMMVTIGVTETSQDRADTLLRRRLNTRLRQRQTPQVTETKQSSHDSSMFYFSTLRVLRLMKEREILATEMRRGMTTSGRGQRRGPGRTDTAGCTRSAWCNLVCFFWLCQEIKESQSLSVDHHLVLSLWCLVTCSLEHSIFIFLAQIFKILSFRPHSAPSQLRQSLKLFVLLVNL